MELPGGETGWLLLYTVIVASMASVVWFFMIRRQMLARMRAVVGVLEDALRPRDQTYTLLGYLVGFRARYELRDPRVPRAWALYTMPPGHVFFYLPVVLLRRERDRLELTLQLRGLVPGEAHLVDPRDRASLRELRRDRGDALPRMSRSLVEAGGRRYTAYYTTSEALERAIRVLEELAAAGADVARVSVSESPAALHVALYPSLASLRESLQALLRAARRLAV